MLGITGWQGELRALPLYQEIIEKNIRTASSASGLPAPPANGNGSTFTNGIEPKTPNFCMAPSGQHPAMHPCVGWVYSPLLRIAETWLRAEQLYAQRPEYKIDFGTGQAELCGVPSESASIALEEPMGDAANAEKDPRTLPYVAAGGFSAGRMAGYDFIG